MKLNKSPMKEPNSPTNQSFKVSQLSPNVKAEFNPGRNDERPCVSPDDKNLQSFCSLQYFNKWRRATIAVTIFGLLASLVLTSFDFISTAEHSSSSILASACDTLQAVVGSFIVLWRFRDENNGDKSVQRESLGSLVFGASFTFNGAVTITVSIYHILSEDRVTGTKSLVLLLSVASCIYFALAATEYYISRKLRSSVVAALCFDDALTACMHLGLLAGELIYNRMPSLWYLDHYTAMGVSFVIFCCGIKILADILIFKDLPFQKMFA